MEEMEEYAEPIQIKHVKPEECVMQVRAFAILRGPHFEHLLTTKEVTLGRVSEEEKTSDVVSISKSKKVSRNAAKIYFNAQTE